MRRHPLSLVLLLATAVLALLAGPGRADIPGVVYNSSNGHYYKLYTSLSSWTSAKSTAESLGGYLATITSQGENDWVQTNLGTSSTPWIGGTDEVTEGTWAWVTGETWSYTNWGPGEPNNVGEEDHLQFRSDGMWNDVPSANNYAYIVEWDSDPNGPPEVPTNLRAVAASDSLVNLTWNDPSLRESGFEIERAVNGGAYATLTSPAANAVSHGDATVAAETNYSYRIRSVGSGGSSAWSNVASVTTPPPPAKNLTATLVTSTRVRLNWTNVATTGQSIEIERGTGNPGTGFTLKGSVAGNAVTYDDTTAPPESTLAYRLRVNGPGGRSGPSGEAYVTTPPASPSGLALTAVSDTRVVLGWTDNSSIETGYELERAVGSPPSAYAPVASLPADYHAYTDDTVQPETTYTYRVRASNASGGSDWSASGTVTTQPRTPANVAAAPASATRMRVSWSDVSAREQGFEIERAVGDEDAFEHIAAVGRGTQEYLDATARPKVSYRYRVAAYSLDGKSNWALADASRMPAMLVVKSLLSPAAKSLRAKAAPQVVLTGEFDTGGAGADLLLPSSVTIGAATIDLPAAVAKGRTIRAEADGARLDLVPVPSTSRVGLVFRAPAGSVGALVPDGTVEVSYAAGTFRATGSVRLAGGTFQPPLKGSLADPSCQLLALALSLKSSSADAFTMKLAFDPTGGVPAQAPQVVVRCGAANVVFPADQYKRSGSRLLLKVKADGGTRTVKLDYAKGLATISVRGGIEIGTLPKGAAPVTVDLTLGPFAFSDTLSVRSTGGSARY